MSNEDLVQQFAIDDHSLQHRRNYLGLGDVELEALGRAAPAAREAAPRIASAIYDRQFDFAPTRRLLDAMAQKKGISVEALREHLEATQATYFVQMFEAASTGLGLAYFEGRLRVGETHDQIDLPVKWYLGVYAHYDELVQIHMLPLIDDERERSLVERAVRRVFNYDMQAVVDAYLLSVFRSMGVRTEEYRDRVTPGTDLGDQVGAMKREVRGLVGRVRGLVETLNQTGTEFTELAESLQQTSSSIAASTEQLNASLVEVANVATEACDVTSRAVATSQQSQEQLEMLTMASTQIGEVVDMISEISGRTNLLALNARIEAARSGEAGRGFAVVAGEVKSLAGRTGDATDEIGARIREVQGGVDEAMEGVQQFRAVTERVDEFGSRIAAAVEEQTATVHEVANVAQLGAADSEKTRDAAATLTALADELAELMTRFDA